MKNHFLSFSTPKLLLATGLAMALAFTGIPSAKAASYYEGKTITMIVGVPGGSGLDLIARNFAKFLSGHIPGKPTIIVKNVPGGGGTKAINFLYAKGRPDGLMINFGPWRPSSLAAGDPSLRYDPTELKFIGTSHSPTTTIVRTDFGSGLKSSADIVKAGVFKIGGRSTSSPLDMAGNLALDIIGAKYDYVPGYRGMSKIKLAIFSNEVQAGHSGYVGYHKFFRDTLVKDGKAIALWSNSEFDENGQPVNNPFVTEFPSFHDVYKKVHGKLPSGPKWEAYKWMMTVEAPMTHTIFAAKGSPDNAVADLRKGYDAMAGDQAYRAAARKIHALDVVFTPRAQAIRTIQTFRNMKPELTQVFKEMRKKGAR